MSKINYNKALFKCSYGISSQLPEQEKLEFVFAGRSNVGKSSLINKICNRKNLARVSATPGKTATINYYDIDLVYFVDLPGYGFAKVSQSERKRWDSLINSYFEANRNSAVLFQLLDSRHAPSKDDIQMMQYLKHFNMPFIVLLTKADKLKKSQLQKTIDEFTQVCMPFGCLEVVLTSSEKGDGIERIHDIINDFLERGIENEQQHDEG